MANERVRDPFDRVVRLAKGLLYRAVEADWASVDRVVPDLCLQSPGFVPANPATGRVYQGKFNQLFLRFSQAWGGDSPTLENEPDNPYSTGWWAGYQQWQSLGAQVRKGERATTIIKSSTRYVHREDGWTPPAYEDADRDGLVGELARRVGERST